MKKFYMLSLIALVFMLSACSLNLYDAIKNSIECELTYHLCNGEDNIVETYTKNELVELNTSIKRENCTFVGWYYDEFLQTECEDSLYLYSDTDLYAKWEVNEDYYTSILSSSQKNGVFTYYETVYKSPISASLIQGTAFAFDEDDNYYYCMTNNHVTSGNDSGKYIILNNGQKYKNYKENSGIAGLFEKTYEIEEIYSDVDYDLSIFKVEKTSDFTINVLEFSNNPLEVNDIVLSYGSPKGETRTLTAGMYLGNKTVDMSEDSTDVTFKALIHTSEIDNGSSGGPLFDELGNVVGVNYAGSMTQTNEFVWGAAIPLNKVYEFIENSNYLNA